MKRLKYALVFVLLIFGLRAQGQFQQQQPVEEKELSPVSRTYALTQVHVTQAPGKTIDGGTVVIRDGLIVAVGKNIAIPPDAITIKGDSLYVYAGFIDGLSRTGVAKPKEDPNASRDRPKDPGNPSPETAGITPQNDVRSNLNPLDKTVEDMRALGFTTAQVVPYGSMLPGSAAVVLLHGKTADDMLLTGKTAFYSELTPAQRVYPNTVIGVIAKWKELYRQALQAKNYETVYASNRSGLNRPAANRTLEAFYPVIDKKMPVLFEADRYLDVQRVLALQSEFGFPLMVADVKEGWDAINKLKASNTKVFLSLDLPEDKKADKPTGDKSAGKKEESTAGKKEENKDPEKEGLEKRKAEAIKSYVSQAATFQKAGVQFGFSALTAKTTDIHKNLRRMIGEGLTEDQALAALTTSPAQLLGISDRLGTVEAGKIANLVVSNKPYFNEKAKVRYIFVDGVMYKYDQKDAPKPDATGNNLIGTWTVSTQSQEGAVEDKVTFKKEGNQLTGSITGSRFQQAATLENVTISGNKLKYSYTTQAEGQSIKVDVEVTVEGDTFKGTSTSGQSPAQNVEGKKDPNR
jgi:imidazolonepropionase-like amidohydrolase